MGYLDNLFGKDEGSVVIVDQDNHVEVMRRLRENHIVDDYPDGGGQPERLRRSWSGNAGPSPVLMLLAWVSALGFGFIGALFLASFLTNRPNGDTFLVILMTVAIEFGLLWVAIRVSRG